MRERHIYQYNKNKEAKLRDKFSFLALWEGIVHIKYEPCIFLMSLKYLFFSFFFKCSLIILTACRQRDFGNKPQPERSACWHPSKCCTCGRPSPTAPPPTYRGWVKVKNEVHTAACSLSVSLICSDSGSADLSLSGTHGLVVKKIPSLRYWG